MVNLYGRKVRRRWWSLLNWLHGYKFCPVRRCRDCDHTTPGHYEGCPTGDPLAHLPHRGAD